MALTPEQRRKIIDAGEQYANQPDLNAPHVMEPDGSLTPEIYEELADVMVDECSVLTGVPTKNLHRDPEVRGLIDYVAERFKRIWGGHNVQLDPDDPIIVNVPVKRWFQGVRRKS